MIIHHQCPRTINLSSSRRRPYGSCSPLRVPNGPLIADASPCLVSFPTTPSFSGNDSKRLPTTTRHLIGYPSSPNPTSMSTSYPPSSSNHSRTLPPAHRPPSTSTDHPSLSLIPLTPLSSNIDVVRMFRGPPSSRPVVVHPTSITAPFIPQLTGRGSARIRQRKQTPLPSECKPVCGAGRRRAPKVD